MPRHLTLALGLIGLLALASGPAARLAVAAQHSDTAPHPAAADPADAAHGEAHAPGDGHEGGHGGGDPNILELQPPLALATAIVFGLMLLILWKFAWGPLAKALDERERANEDAFRRSEHARAEAERLLAEHRAVMNQAQEQVKAILEEARRDANTTATDILRKAQDEAELARQRAERDIVTARDQALAEIWTRSADLAVTVAGKVLAREIGPEEHRRLVETATSELPSSPLGNGREGALA